MHDNSAAEKEGPPPSASYRDLLGLPGARRIVFTQIVGPIAAQTWALVLILLVLEYFGSPALAGLCGLLSQIGVVLLPVAGAVLDSHGNKRIVILDYVISATGIGLIAVLAFTETLTVPSLLFLVTIVGLTSQFSELGLRTALPAAVPEALLDRANALNFGGRAVARLISPLIATGVTAQWNPTVGAVVTAGVYLIAVSVVLGYAEPAVERSRSTKVFRDAYDGVSYTFRNPVTRNVSLLCAFAFVGWGSHFGAVPVLVKNTMHSGTMFLGLVFAVFAIADIASGVLFGRVNTAGREWFVLTALSIVAACGFLVMSLGNVVGVLFGIALVGIAETPFDQAAYGLRQRWTTFEWLGRATSVAIAVDWGSYAVGTAVTGAISEWSPRAALIFAGTVVMLAAVIPPIVIRSSTR